MEKVEIAKKILLSIHVVASILWVGAVYMGAVVDWPAAKNSVPKTKFPFKFIIGQGTRVFYSVYTGIILLWFSGIGLTVITLPVTERDIVILCLKLFCLLTMTVLTLYGTFFTWPKLQTSLDQEANKKYKNYIFRAYITLISGIIAAILGVNLYN
ncbi:hypothetical protein [Sphingobacterium faecium]|uniref:hypothetical protein n=1 Tax=Sphingobacterium faecium TaxID=34087 RepID=UPI00320986D9